MSTLLPMLIVIAGAAANMDKIKAMVGYSKNVAVQSELNEITKMMVLDKITGDVLPGQDGFAAYLAKNMKVPGQKAPTRDVTRDQFGTPYRVAYPSNLVRVTSAGQDVQFDTSDDIYSERELD